LTSSLAITVLTEHISSYYLALEFLHQQHNY